MEGRHLWTGLPATDSAVLPISQPCMGYRGAVHTLPPILCLTESPFWKWCCRPEAGSHLQKQRICKHRFLSTSENGKACSGPRISPEGAACHQSPLTCLKLDVSCQASQDAGGLESQDIPVIQRTMPLALEVRAGPSLPAVEGLQPHRCGEIIADSDL